MFDAIDARGGLTGVPGRVLAGLRVALGGFIGRGTGTGVVPATAGPTRPRVLKGTGTGRPPAGATGEDAKVKAKRAARDLALRDLAEQLERLRYDARRTIGDWRRGDPAGATRLDGFVKGARELSARPLPDGRCYVELELTLDGLDAALAGR